MEISIKTNQLKIQIPQQQSLSASQTIEIPTSEATFTQDSIQARSSANKGDIGENLELFTADGETSTKDYLNRFKERNLSKQFGGEEAKFEVGYESAAPVVLASSQDPSMMEIMQKTQQNQAISQIPGYESSNGLQGNLVTGAVIQPSEVVAIRTGVATSVNSVNSESARQFAQEMKNTDSSLYVDVGFNQGIVASNITVSKSVVSSDSFKVGAGVAVSVSEEVKIAASFIHHQSNQTTFREDSIRVGAEVEPKKDYITGVNLTAPINSTTQTTAVGVYAGIKFE